jgi:hypothetical protein
MNATQLWPSLVRLGSCHVRPMCAQAASERQPEGFLKRLHRGRAVCVDAATVDDFMDTIIANLQNGGPTT